jgi:glycosyltransferase involved in cell wall biosynthesis
MPKVLFVGLGSSAPCYYRCALPASEIGADWVGVVGQSPDQCAIVAGNKDRVNWNDYDIIVAQQPGSPEWQKWIETRQPYQKVVFECDDFLHGVRKIEHHRFQKQYHKKKLKQLQANMAACSAMICSTHFLSNQYAKYNPNQFVSEVGIKTDQYDVPIPERDEIHIGWAGGTGHHKAVAPWLQVILRILQQTKTVKFVSIGTNYASAINDYLPDRGISVPWTQMENLPYALTNMDIAIAPAHDSKYFRSKSDLRWLEASAVGIPVIANPITYHEIEHGKTGFLTDNENGVEHWLDKLIFDRDLRESISTEAKKYVQESRDSSVTSKIWEENFAQIAEL